MFKIHRGDCLDILRGLPSDSVDSVVTDPPYGLSFMGKRWDYDVPAVEVWQECRRVLKPGGHLLAFAGARTQHRMAVRIEDGGFEIRDMLAWVYGSGYPKSHDVSTAMEQYQAGDFEQPQAGNVPLVVYQVTAFLRAARDSAGWTNRQIDALFGTNGMAGHWTTAASQPAVPSVAKWAVLKDALGFSGELDDLVAALGSADRGESSSESATRFLAGLDKAKADRKPAGAWGTGLKPAIEPITLARKPPAGRVANNVRQHGVGALNIGGCRVTDQARWPANLLHDGGEEVSAALGAASRFFYNPKASKADREAGNDHPTVKPTELMRYLCRLITPPGGLVLDPFMGSGSTGKAAVLENFRFIGCELSDEYADIAQGRISRAAQAFTLH